MLLPGLPRAAPLRVPTPTTPYASPMQFPVLEYHHVMRCPGKTYQYLLRLAVRCTVLTYQYHLRLAMRCPLVLTNSTAYYGVCGTEAGSCGTRRLSSLRQIINALTAALLPVLNAFLVRLCRTQFMECCGALHSSWNAATHFMNCQVAGAYSRESADCIAADGALMGLAVTDHGVSNGHLRHFGSLVLQGCTRALLPLWHAITFACRCAVL